MAAENENGQEKTEQPTGKRITESREKGQIPRSKELNTVIELMAGGGFILIYGGYLGTQLSQHITAAFTIDREQAFDTALLVTALHEQIRTALLTLTPLFVVLALAALFGSVLIGGLNFSTKALMPNFGKLNPIKGIKRLFSSTGLIELVKALGKFLVVSIVAGMALWGIVDEILGLGQEPAAVAIVHAGELSAWIFFTVSSALIILALIDVPFQLWNHNKQLRMTLQEVKDEQKETDGRPEIKSRIRQLQYQMAQKRMMAEVPKADVVITNPTHYAVALRYDADTMRAPRLLAKGMDSVAFAIRELAEQHDVMRIEAPEVARAIYFTTELNQEIPNGLFVAVARILAYVYQLRRQDIQVELPHDLPVPPEYLDPNRARQARRKSL
ncbi:flagellar biosynthesis protein FlhB [Thiospirillum jenense]|uniref:Flagellar biosynthetic protein FlhB n=1 Tax=Thiospirillum jenense TaxID=1653858 RepID=A0A839HAX3_9GAMM|nr:flagellar biosynthesis protein FlhB [Thiospirillum jenense]MBB1125774.1 flagellar biosynthesis protein FlhB [Thiospirillum jenense]